MNRQITYGIIGFGYFLIGILVLIFKKFIIPLEDTKAYLFGALFIIYGAFRVYRAIKNYKK